MAVSFAHIKRHFQDSFIFGEASSSHCFRKTTSTQQLLVWSSYFFRAAAFFEEIPFQNSHFFAAVIFLEQLLFQGQTSTGQPILENRYFFNGTATFWAEELFRINISTKQVLLLSIDFFRSATFWKKLIFQKTNISLYLFF